MNLRSIDLNLLVVFDAVYTMGNISTAAESIGMSQPAMSNALRRFRVTMNDPLFIRHPQGVAPTRKADELAPVIHQTLQTLRLALTPPGNYDFATDTSSFRVAMEELGEVILTPSLVQKLSKTAPGIRLSVSPQPRDQIQDDIRYGRIDLSIDYIKQRSTNDCNYLHLFDEDRVCVCRHDHPGDFSDTLSMKSYLNNPHVVLNQRIRGVTSVHSFLAERGLERNVAMQVPSYHTVPLILESTNFIATVPRRIARHFSSTYALRSVELPFTMPPLSFYLQWHDSRTKDPRHTWFRNLIVELFSQRT